MPPSKARKIQKDRDVKHGHTQDVFSNDEPISRIHRSCTVLDSDDDLPSDFDMDAPPETFQWTISDIPSVCPEVDCNDKVITNLAPPLIKLFREHMEVIHNSAEGIEDDMVYYLNLKICVQLRIAIVANRRQRRAEKHGLVHVDFQLLANRIWDIKSVVDPFMLDSYACTKTFIWTNLNDDLKSFEYSLSKLNKGKDVPREIVSAAWPG